MWHGIHTLARWRSGAASLTLGLALLLAACAGVSTTPTPTPTPTKTPTPACTTWSVVPSPTTTQYPQSVLKGVVAVSPTDAWAVGSTYIGDGNSTSASLIERWNGSAWSIVTSPGGPFLSGVAAVSANDIWAVGNATGGVPGIPTGSANPSILHWNGTQWSVTPSATGAITLNSVVARASNEVWAVGSSTSAGISTPLTERWNGSAWQTVTSPSPTGANESILFAAAAVPGTNQLWAVGFTLQTPRASYSQALIERWDGSSWKIVANPTLPTGAFGATLSGVVALSATDAWAVGNYTDSSHTIRTLILHWDGASWKVAASPDVWGRLTGVAAVGAQDIRVVGIRYLDSANSNNVGIVERWNGTTWSVADTPTPQGVTDSFPQAIAANGAGGYWMTGYYYSTNYHSLIARCG